MTGLQREGDRCHGLARRKHFHFAALGEIYDPTGLRYDVELGQSNALTGGGPLDGRGWVRTSVIVPTTVASAGAANCNSWASADPAHFGTTARPNPSGTRNTGFITPAYELDPTACDSGSIRVWCVED